MGLKYDREKFISAKTFILYAANVTAVANSTFKSAKGSGLDSCERDYGVDTAFIGEPSITISIEKSTVEDLKTALDNAYEQIHGFNTKMDEMVGIISKKLDPDLEAEIKKIEQAALKDYLNIGLAGGLLDTLQIFELIEKYKDDPNLSLTDDQKEILELLTKQAKATIEYNNMNGWEKFWTGAAVFVVSAAEGVLSVGELVVDGALTVGGGAIGLGVWAIAGADSRDEWLGNVANVVDYDAVENVYDAVIDASGLNGIIAYGGVHTVGVAAGKIGGEALLTIIPGGKAAQIAVQACKSAGKTMDKSADLADKMPGATEEEVLHRRFLAANGSAAVSAASTVGINELNSLAKTEVSANPFDYNLGKYQAGMSGIRAGKVLGNAGIDYSISGSEEGFEKFLGDNAITYGSELLGGAAADKAKLNKMASEMIDSSSDKNIYQTVSTAKSHYDKEIKPMGKALDQAFDKPDTELPTGTRDITTASPYSRTRLNPRTLASELDAMGRPGSGRNF